MPDEMLDRMPDSDRIPERMSEYMSEFMSDGVSVGGDHSGSNFSEHCHVPHSLSLCCGLLMPDMCFRFLRRLLRSQAIFMVWQMMHYLKFIANLQ